MRAGDTVAPALIVMLLGGWLSAESLLPGRFDAESHWPLLIAAAGVCFLVGYLAGGGPWQLFLGTSASLTGLPLWLFSSGLLPWPLLEAVWPAFLVAAGVACLAYLAAAPDAPWPLVVPGLGAVASGAAGLLFSLGLLALDPVQVLTLVWPLLLVVTGFLGLTQAIWTSLSGRRGGA